MPRLFQVKQETMQQVTGQGLMYNRCQCKTVGFGLELLPFCSVPTGWQG
jgi:hypothetical protein